MTGHSPTSKPPLEKQPHQLELTFPEAMQAVIDGHKVTKLEWGDPDIYILLFEGTLKIKLEDELLHDLIVSDGDMIGTDWVIVDTAVVH